MKKLIISGLVFGIMIMFTAVPAVLASENPAAVKNAIAKYKKKDYVGCISDLKQYTQDDPSNAVAWYYLGNAYMNISLKAEAQQAFDKVVSLNTVPKLTSFAIQAKLCMENPEQCNYQNFTAEEVEQLKANPTEFLTQYFANKNKVEETVQQKDPDTIEIEKLIDGTYPNKIHPSAQDFIMQERLKMNQNEMNSTPVNKSYIPEDEKYAQIIEMLKNKNNDLTAFAMLMQPQDNKSGNIDYIELIKQYQNAGENKQLSAEMLQLMLMPDMISEY